MNEQVTKYENIKEAYEHFIQTGRIRATRQAREHVESRAVIQSLMSS